MPKSYPSDMTDQEWEIIHPLIPAAKKYSNDKAYAETISFCLQLKLFK